MSEKRYYWLKLKEDFFESNDIQVVEAMPSGKDFIIFYLKLLCKSIRHEGNLRLTAEIPYNEETLAAITHTDVNVVKQAIQIFSGLHLIELMDDGTYFMSRVQDMLGSETKWAEKKRIYRGKQQLLEGQTEDNVLTMSDKSIDIRDKSIEYRDKSIDKRDNKNKLVKSELDQEFEVLWSLYPKKQGKQKAKTCYLSARKKGTSFEEVEDGIKRYCDYIESKKIDTQYIKQGSTFFSQQAWQDEYEAKQEYDDSRFGGIL